MTTPLAHRWDCLANVASALHKGRAAGYPKLVEAGKLTKADADRRIAVMAAVAEIFHAAYACRLPDPALLTLPVCPEEGSSEAESPSRRVDRCDIVEELLRARDVSTRRAAADPDNPAIAYQLACIDAMIDWHMRFVDGPIFCVRITLQLRAANAAQHPHQAPRRAAA